MAYSNNSLTSSFPNQKGFTLLELLAVITIIGILAAVVGTFATGTNDKAMKTKAQAEMALISKALEDYKLRNGDYPQINSTIDHQNKVIFESLFGQDPFAGNGDIHIRHATGNRNKKGKKPINGGYYIEPSLLTLGKKVGDEYEVVPIEEFENGIGPEYILDPWGVPYYYRYKVSGSKAWGNPGFILWTGAAYDEGGEPTTNPDKIPASGIFDLDNFQSSEENLNDVVYEYTN